MPRLNLPHCECLLVTHDAARAILGAIVQLKGGEVVEEADEGA